MYLLFNVDDINFKKKKYNIILVTLFIIFIFYMLCNDIYN